MVRPRCAKVAVLLVAANTAEEENTTTGARSGAAGPRPMLEVKGMRLPEGVAAQ